jgi:NADPH:quinone reductase-like Zn-dependent oxidoreductase
MAQVVRFHELGGPEVLRIEEHEVRLPEPGEVRLHVKAIGINRAETLLRKGQYIEQAELPSSLGLEAAGIVEAIGENVQDIKIGDVVSVIPPPSMTRWPAYGELAVFPARLIVKHPPLLNWEMAAAVWMQYITAYGALIDIANLKKGDFVVVTAASSSVGLAAIQIANHIGAISIAVTRTAEKRHALLNAGATHVISLDEGDLLNQLVNIAGKDGIRVVFDPVAGPNIQPITAAMSYGGIFIEYGGLSSETSPFPVGNVLMKSLTLRGYLMHEITNDPIRLDKAKKFILEGLRSGALIPIIAKVFQFNEIIEAHKFVESNEQFGKIVVTL